VIAAAHNTVWRDGDPTAPAEINAIRRAAQVLGSIQLTGGTLYSICELCPMCLAASHWAKITRIVFGAAIAEARAAGFRELPIAAQALITLGHSPLQIEGGLRRDECIALFAQ
jgi:guanine deaminase